MKRIYSLLLAVCICFPFLSISAFAAERGEIAERVPILSADKTDAGQVTTLPDTLAPTVGDTVTDEEAKALVRSAVTSNDAVQNFVTSEISVNTSDVVGALKAATEDAEAKSNLDKQDDNTIVRYVAVNAKSASVKKHKVGTVDTGMVTSMLFDVKPVAEVKVETSEGKKTISAKIPNAAITAPIAFRLPVDGSVPEKAIVKVWHRGSEDANFSVFGNYAVQADENGNKFIELSSDKFSEFKYELTEDIAGANYSFNLSLKDSIDINFYVKYPVGNPSDYTVEYTFDGVTKTETMKNSGVNTIIVAKCPAAYMGDMVHIRILYGRDGAVIKEGDYSIRTYCENKIKSTDPLDDDKLKNLCKAALDYGACAQIYFEHNTDDLVNATYHGEIPGEVPSEYNVKQKVGTDTKIKGISTNLSLKSYTEVNYFLTSASGYTAENIVISSVTVGGISYPDYTVVKQSDGILRVKVYGIKSSELNKAIFVTTGSGMTLRYSPLSYAWINQNVTEDGLGNLCRALYKYYLCASEYFSK